MVYFSNKYLVIALTIMVICLSLFMVANMTGIKCVCLRDSLKFIANLMTRNHSVDIHKSLLLFKIKSNKHKLIGNSFLNIFEITHYF